MDPNRFKDTFAKLEVLDDRLSYKVRKSVQNRSTEPEKLDERVRDVAEMVLELKDVVRELMLAIASKPGASRRSDFELRLVRGPSSTGPRLGRYPVRAREDAARGREPSARAPAPPGPRTSRRDGDRAKLSGLLTMVSGESKETAEPRGPAVFVSRWCAELEAQAQPELRLPARAQVGGGELRAGEEAVGGRFAVDRLAGGRVDADEVDRRRGLVGDRAAPGPSPC